MVLRKILDHLDGKSTPPCQRSTEEPVRQLVKTRRHTLILREKSELCANGTLAPGFLADAHPVVVQVAERWTELSRHYFKDFHRPDRLFAFRRALRSSTGDDE